MSIKFGTTNILESGTVTATSEENNYPKERLFDRYLGLMWKATSTATQTVKVDQGATGNLEIDTLVIPAGHNLDGCTLTFEYSANDADWYDQVTSWVQSGSGLIVKTGTARTQRYWRVVISGASSASEAAEVFMTLLAAFASVGPEGLKTAYRRNVLRDESMGGVAQFVKLGAERRVYAFSLLNMDATDYATFQAILTGWDGCKPFVFVDHDDETLFAEIEGAPGAAHKPGIFKDSDQITLVEVL